MTQRSCDLGLGVPFNIASCKNLPLSFFHNDALNFLIVLDALLTRLIGHVCNLPVGDLVYAMGDCHIYKTHMEAMQTQIKRTPTAFPTLAVPGTPKLDPCDYKIQDLQLQNYMPQDAIAMKMAV